MYADAATAWRNTNDRYPGNRNPPRGSAVYWTGGSHGYGHIAISVGGGKVRSTDAGGSGRVATVDLGWVEAHWGLPYAGWAWDINEQTIGHDKPEPEPPEDDMPDYITASIEKKVELKNGSWYPIEWAKGTDKYVNPGEPGISVTGPYSATLQVSADRKGGVLQVSWVEWDTKKKEAAETSGIDSMGDVSNGCSARIGSVQDGRLLRARVRIQGGDGTLTTAKLSLLSFRPK